MSTVSIKRPKLFMNLSCELARSVSVQPDVADSSTKKLLKTHERAKLLHLDDIFLHYDESQCV